MQTFEQIQHGEVLEANALHDTLYILLLFFMVKGENFLLFVVTQFLLSVVSVYFLFFFMKLCLLFVVLYETVYLCCSL